MTFKYILRYLLTKQISVQQKQTFSSTSCRFAIKRDTKRMYLSRMLLNPAPDTVKKDTLNCHSQQLFLYNEILYNCHPGAFYYLPLGQRALEKLTRIIDDELQYIGAQKISMPTLIPATLWKKTGRWDNDELFKLSDRQKKMYCLGPTHEELVTQLVASLPNFALSRFPIMLYQITRKFRDEMRPKNGFLRGREFDMKDLYTFDVTEESATATYNLVCQSYNNILDRLGLQYRKVEGSTGNIGGKLSHEYHLCSDVGEDLIYLCDSCGHGVNSELVESEESTKCPTCNIVMKQHQGIEIGHTFLLGTKYSKILKAEYLKEPMEMGCYGIGVSRLLQASVEVLSKDRDNIRWPSLIAPYQVCLIPQKEGFGSEQFNLLTDNLSDRLNSLPNLHGEVVIDDRIHKSVHFRLKAAARQGYPYCVIAGKKSLEDPPLYEVVNNLTEETQFMSLEQVVNLMSTIQTI